MKPLFPADEFSPYATPSLPHITADSRGSMDIIEVRRIDLHEGRIGGLGNLSIVLKGTKQERAAMRPLSA